jgi:hypothetical protein
MRSYTYHIVGTVFVFEGDIVPWRHGFVARLEEQSEGFGSLFTSHLGGRGMKLNCRNVASTREAPACPSRSMGDE